jgi:hypothetical protein
VVFGSILLGSLLAAPLALVLDPPDWTQRSLLLAPLVGILTVIGFQAGFMSFREGAVSVVAPIVAPVRSIEPKVGRSRKTRCTAALAASADRALSGTSATRPLTIDSDRPSAPPRPRRSARLLPSVRAFRLRVPRRPSECVLPVRAVRGQSW